MASEHREDVDHEEDEGDQFIDSADVLAEVPDDGDHPMDDGDDEVGEAEGEGDDEEVVWEDNSEQHFSEHKQSVFAVSAHPTEPLAASGGEDDIGYIWDITDGEVVVKLTGHTDSVASIAFSADGEMIATGGMDGKVRVWRRVGKENYKIWEFLTELQGPDEVVVCKTVDRSVRVIVAEVLDSGFDGILKAMSYSQAQMTRRCGYGNVSVFKVNKKLNIDSYQFKSPFWKCHAGVRWPHRRGAVRRVYA